MSVIAVFYLAWNITTIQVQFTMYEAETVKQEGTVQLSNLSLDLFKAIATHEKQMENAGLEFLYLLSAMKL
ncbi:hypothetical protein GDO81_002428 [Engystomops pustulosus]|uniref:Uncharacterized protein n=1 Tax=Engystomops pustulosus TaxID=76066 RepID=A0AAV7DLR1_ENGPU|nr:hypothetical protein GDO81_002428 [Engystomops pustulosus]